MIITLQNLKITTWDPYKRFPSPRDVNS